MPSNAILEQKKTIVAELAADIKDSAAGVVVNYQGITVDSDTKMRKALREAGADVLGVVSIFTYGMQKGLDRLAAANLKNISLTNFDTIVEVAAETG